MNQSSNFTDKHLASLAAIMLLAPAVSFMLKEKTIDIAADEESYVRSYIRYGYYVLLVLLLALLVRGAYNFFFSISILYRINYGLLGLTLAMIIFGVFSIINNKTLSSTTTTTNETTDYDAGVVGYFIPLYNYYLRYNESNENNVALKESVMLRSLYLIVISIWPTTTAIFLGLFIIVARCIMLAVGLDMFKTNGKNALDTIFYRNIEELIAYPLGLLRAILKAPFGKSKGLYNEVDSRKITYSELDTRSNARTLISYVIALGAIGYRGYVTWLASAPTVGVSLALLPQIGRIGKTLMTLPSGKLPRIPILYTLLGGRQNKQELQTTPQPSSVANNEPNTMTNNDTTKDIFSR